MIFFLIVAAIFNYWCSHPKRLPGQYGTMHSVAYPVVFWFGRFASCGLLWIFTITDPHRSAATIATTSILTVIIFVLTWKDRNHPALQKKNHTG